MECHTLAAADRWRAIVSSAVPRRPTSWHKDAVPRWHITHAPVTLFEGDATVTFVATLLRGPLVSRRVPPPPPSAAVVAAARGTTVGVPPVRAHTCVWAVDPVVRLDGAPHDAPWTADTRLLALPMSVHEDSKLEVAFPDAWLDASDVDVYGTPATVGVSGEWKLQQGFVTLVRPLDAATFAARAASPTSNLPLLAAAYGHLLKNAIK